MENVKVFSIFDKSFVLSLLCDNQIEKAKKSYYGYLGNVINNLVLVKAPDEAIKNVCSNLCDLKLYLIGEMNPIENKLIPIDKQLIISHSNCDILEFMDIIKNNCNDLNIDNFNKVYEVIKKDENVVS